MLPLDSQRWCELRHAYGSAADVPQLLQQLRSLPPNDQSESEPYFSLWSALCHQGDVYTASYAALPHIVDAIRGAPEHAPWTLFLMVACIEIARTSNRGPTIPDDLADAYHSALGEVPVLVGRSAEGKWDHWYCGAALAATAAAKGFPALAEALLELDPSSVQDLLKRKHAE